MRRMVPGDKPLAVSLIKEWRYIREAESLYPMPRRFGGYDKRPPGPEHPLAISNADEEPFDTLGSSTHTIIFAV
jgi:hypothetical protein